MNRPLLVTVISIAALACAAPVHANVTLFAEGPTSASVGAEIPLRLRARVTESVNAMKATVIIMPDSVQVIRFDDTESAVRLWLERGTPVAGGVRLQGVIPGGVGPAFTDVVELGTLWVRPTAQDAIRLVFTDAEFYLNQPTPTKDTVKTVPLMIRTGPSVGAEAEHQNGPVLVDTDVRVVRESELNDGKRTLVFDIKTNQGTVDEVRIRERWFGIVGNWRNVRNSSTLSDAWGFSILDVVLSESMGGLHVATIVPMPLIVLWVVGIIAIIAVVIRRRIYH